MSIGGITATVERLVIQNGGGVFGSLSGGGILNNGTLTVKQSTIQNNTARGGIRNLGVLLVDSSTISGNASFLDGGGLFNNAQATLINTTVSGNTTTGSGGGIHNSIFPFGGLLTLVNTTVTGNTASFRGGGLNNNIDSRATLRNTIIAGNHALFGFGPDCARDFARPITSEGHNLIGTTASCGYEPSVGDLTDVDPRLGPLQDNGGLTLTHALLSGSLAIDAGNPAPPGSGGTACEAVDQRGAERPLGAACDIGAFEAAPPLFLHGSGGTANPPVLFLDANPPTGGTAKYKDSPALSVARGNPWKRVGTWTAAPELTGGTVTALGDVQVWLGLKNSDDQGTRFDLRVEVLKDASDLVTTGELRCITGITRNPAQAKEVAVALEPFDPVTFDGSEEVLSLRVLTRIGTGAGCGGHSNAIGLRLYFDAVSRDSSIGAVEFALTE